MSTPSFRRNLLAIPPSLFCSILLYQSSTRLFFSAPLPLLLSKLSFCLPVCFRHAVSAAATPTTQLMAHISCGNYSQSATFDKRTSPSSSSSSYSVSSSSNQKQKIKDLRFVHERKQQIGFLLVAVVVIVFYL